MYKLGYVWMVILMVIHVRVCVYIYVCILYMHIYIYKQICTSVLCAGGTKLGLLDLSAMPSPGIHVCICNICLLDLSAAIATTYLSMKTTVW